MCQVLWEQVGPERKYFTADMESFTLLLDHTMQAADADIDVHGEDSLHALPIRSRTRGPAHAVVVGPGSERAQAEGRD